MVCCRGRRVRSLLDLGGVATSVLMLFLMMGPLLNLNFPSLFCKLTNVGSDFDHRIGVDSALASFEAFLGGFFACEDNGAEEQDVSRSLVPVDGLDVSKPGEGVFDLFLRRSLKSVNGHLSALNLEHFVYKHLSVEERFEFELVVSHELGVLEIEQGSVGFFIAYAHSSVALAFLDTLALSVRNLHIFYRPKLL